MDFVEATAHHAQVVLHNALPLAAELVMQLFVDGLEQALLVQTGFLRQWRGGKERTLEGIALHAVLQFRVGGLFTCNPESVEIEHPEAVVDNQLAGLTRKAGPYLIRALQAVLDDEDPALFQSGQGTGVAEYIWVRRHHHVHEVVLAVEADRFRRG